MKKDDYFGGCLEINARLELLFFFFFFLICSVVLYLKNLLTCHLLDNYTMNNYPYKTRINRSQLVNKSNLFRGDVALFSEEPKQNG